MDSKPDKPNENNKINQMKNIFVLNLIYRISPIGLVISTYFLYCFVFDVQYFIYKPRHSNEYHLNNDFSHAHYIWEALKSGNKLIITDFSFFIIGLVLLIFGIHCMKKLFVSNKISLKDSVLWVLINCGILVYFLINYYDSLLWVFS